MLYGYKRITKLVEEARLLSGLECDEVFVDVGVHSIYKKEEMLNKVVEGDEIVVGSLDDAFIDINDLISTIDVVLSKGVVLRVEDGSFSTELLKDEAVYKMMINVLEFSFRTRVEIDTRKVVFPDGFYSYYKEYKAKVKNGRQLADEMYIGKSTFYKLIKEFEEVL